MIDPGPPLRVTVEAGTPTVVRPVGEIDILASEHFADTVQRLVPTDGPVVFDLAEVAFIDSSGLAVLLQVAADVPVVVRNPSPVVRRVIERTGLADVLRLEP